MTSILSSRIRVFLGSTFEDLVIHRRVVRDALDRLHLDVECMEQFGARDERPAGECQAIVRSCQIYIGILGMRYGSIPVGHTNSMIHLEYTAAVEAPGITRLFYLIREDRHRLLPKAVEIGAGGERLRDLKATIKRDRMPGFFKSPEDLALQIVLDILPVIERIQGGNSLLGSP